jgi:hypothetical protein
VGIDKVRVGDRMERKAHAKGVSPGLGVQVAQAPSVKSQLSAA